MYIPQTLHSLPLNMKKKMKKYEKYHLSKNDIDVLTKVLHGGYYNPSYSRRRRR